MFLNLFIIAQIIIQIRYCMSLNELYPYIDNITTTASRSTTTSRPKILTQKPRTTSQYQQITNADSSSMDFRYEPISTTETSTLKTTAEDDLLKKLKSINSRDFGIAYTDFQSKVAQSNKLNSDMLSLLNRMDMLLIAERDSISKIEYLTVRYPLVTSDIVKFNVGGTTFATYLTTITKKILKNNGDGFYEPNLLEALVSGLIDVKYDDNKAIFIDRNPQYFNYILNYLRMANTNETFKYPASLNDFDGFLAEAEFYNLVGVKEKFMGFGDSAILKGNQSADLIRLCGFSANDAWRIVYRASKDGFGSKDFHFKVDGTPKTLTIIKTTNNYTFGGKIWFICLAIFFFSQ